MKYIWQFLIILVITSIGEGIKYIVNIPIPASIYGMIILFICLNTGIIKLDQIKDVGMFLLEIMPIMFIPAGVGLIEAWDILYLSIVPILIITFVSFGIVIVVTGRVSQRLILQYMKSKGK